MGAIGILHFSDVLCVWAYVSQVRLDELKRTFAEAVDLDYRFVQVFGAAEAKLSKAWAERGGFAGYAAHVRGIVEQFGHVPVHPDVWQEHRPRSSMPAHLVLCAARAFERTDPERWAGSSERLAWRIREAFFRDLVDVSRHAALRELVAELGLPVDAIESRLESGEAHAQLASDLELVREHDVRASPTLIFNEGRQRLTGNVGYRIIEANVRELLERPVGQQSWC